MTPIVDKTLLDYDAGTGDEQDVIKVGSALASWSDISIIFDFLQRLARTNAESAEVEDNNVIKLTKGLQTFLMDKHEDNSPDYLYSRRLQEVAP